MKNELSKVINTCKIKIEQELIKEIKLPLNSVQQINRQLTLSHGDPGLLIFFAKCKNEKICIFLRNRILSNLQKVPINLSLFSGLCGIGFSFLISKSILKDNKKYLLQIDNLICDNLDNVCQQAVLNPYSAKSFDVIQGLSGIGQYLLSLILSGCDCRNKISEKLFLVLDSLKKISDQNNEYQSWWINNESQFLTEEKDIYTEGNYNLGMAHGMLGPLTLFLKVYKSGISYDTKSYILNWLNELISFRRNDGQQTIFWPRESAGKVEVFPGNTFLNRNGWCYGNSIICDTLFFAGDVLNKPTYSNIANELLININKSNNDELRSPIFCHGKAGLLAILKRINNNYLKNSNTDAVEKLEKLIIDDFSDKNKYGFIDNSEPVIPGYEIVKDKSGILEGTSGILLAVTTKFSKEENYIDWYDIFLI